MSTFPEEQLTSPAGYYAGEPGQTLNNGRWKIIRKLGWGPSSSTWLAVDSNNSDNFEAIKIFTVAATNDSSASNERDILQRLGNHMLNIPVIKDHFVEESAKGKHLCLALTVLGTSIDSIREKNMNGNYFPLGIVQKILYDTLEVLIELHNRNIAHGAVIPDNLLRFAPQAAASIMEHISKYPSAEAHTITRSDNISYSVVQSQPLVDDIEWDRAVEYFDYSGPFLSNFRYAKHGDSGPNTTIVPSPELLDGKATGPKTDIWMLGYTTYLLLTGTPLFGADVTAEALNERVANLPSTLESKLSKIPGFPSAELPATVSFITSCLAINPNDRASADDLLGLDWIVEGGAR